MAVEVLIVATVVQVVEVVLMMVAADRKKGRKKEAQAISRINQSSKQAKKCRLTHQPTNQPTKKTQANTSINTGASAPQQSRDFSAAAHPNLLSSVKSLHKQALHGTTFLRPNAGENVVPNLVAVVSR